MVKTANRTKDVLEATQNGQELTLVPTKPMRAGIADVFDAAQMVQATSADNFPDDAIARLGLQSMCKSAAAKQMDEMPEDGVNPRYYYCHVVQINKQNYQGVNTAIRTVIVDWDNNVWASTSEQIAKDVYSIAAVFGKDEIANGCIIKFESVKSGTRKVHKLVFSAK